jgi:hypothetical protein
VKGKVSAYNNGNTINSTTKLKLISQNAEAFTLNELDEFLTEYGISNKILSDISGYSAAHLSEIRNGKTPMPLRIQQHLYLLIEKFKSDL